MITVIMISGEKITGVLVQDTPNYLYVQTTLEYDEQAIQLFGKEYCEANKTLINKLPKDEIKEVFNMTTRQVYLEALEEENKLLSLIEETEDIDDTLYYQRKLMNHYLKTNQLDKRHAAYAEYADLVKSIEELDTLDI